jgi:hypothetical protein
VPTPDGMSTLLAAEPLPPAFDVSRPNIARIYDYYLGGKNSFEADRVEAERLLAIYPLLQDRARENRMFLARAVAWLAREQGIRQFLDVGAGLPTAQNTHQVAQGQASDCRVAYVDYDPVVAAHAAALLCERNAVAILGDMRAPASILAHPDVLGLINLGQPVGLIMTLTLHFVDASTAAAIVAAFTSAIAPGSYVVLSVGSADQETGGQLAGQYRAGTLYNHSPTQVEGFLAGLELVGPGLSDARNWEPASAPIPPAREAGRVLAAVGLKRVTGPGRDAAALPPVTGLAR